MFGKKRIDQIERNVEHLYSTYDRKADDKETSESILILKCEISKLQDRLAVLEKKHS